MREPNLNREQELGIAIEFCKRFLLDGENGSQQDAEKQQSLPIGDEQQRKAEVLAKLVELKLELEQHKAGKNHIIIFKTNYTLH